MSTFLDFFPRSFRAIVKRMVSGKSEHDVCIFLLRQWSRTVVAPRNANRDRRVSGEHKYCMCTISKSTFVQTSTRTRTRYTYVYMYSFMH